MSKKNILIHTIVFSPDGVSTAYLYNDIALKFKAEGHNVSVITTTPHYNIVESELKMQPLRKKAFGLYYISDYKGIKVKHVYQKKYNNTPLRILGFLYWHIISFFLCLSEKKVDIILSPSPPLTIGFLNVIIAKIKRTKTIYNVQEIYPDLLIEEGGLKSKTIISFLKWMEKFVYNKSDLVTTIDEVFYNTISPRFQDKDKLRIIPNFVDTDIYKPLDIDKIKLNANFPQNTESLKIMYAGNIGHAQDWEPLIKLALSVRKEAIEFFVIGEGVMKEYLEKEKKKYDLDKIHIIPYQPREMMPELLAFSDLQFIFMAPSTEGHGFPSKVYTIMACAKPIMVCSGIDTPIIQFLQGKNCAHLITERNLDTKVSSMTTILKNSTKAELKRMGKNGYKFIEAKYSKNVVTNYYMELVNEVTSRT